MDNDSYLYLLLAVLMADGRTCGNLSGGSCLNLLDLLPPLVGQVLRHSHLALRRLRRGGGGRGLRRRCRDRGDGGRRDAASAAARFFGHAFEIGFDVSPLGDRDGGALVEDGPVALSRVVAFGGRNSLA